MSHKSTSIFSLDTDQNFCLSERKLPLVFRYLTFLSDFGINCCFFENDIERKALKIKVKELQKKLMNF